MVRWAVHGSAVVGVKDQRSPGACVPAEVGDHRGHRSSSQCGRPSTWPVNVGAHQRGDPSSWRPV